MAYGAAKSYSDFYKGKDKVPNTNEEDTILPGKKPDSMVAARKLAMKRRLLNKKTPGR